MGREGGNQIKRARGREGGNQIRKTEGREGGNQIRAEGWKGGKSLGGELKSLGVGVKSIWLVA